jgi:hypothetical protein
MSWLISNALLKAYENSHCSLGRAVESSAESSSDGEPSAPLNVMHTQHPFSHRDKTMVAWNRSPFGPIYAPLMDSRGEALLTWYREGFLAQTSAPPGQILAPMANRGGLTAKAADYGGICAESSARLNLELCTLKTPRYCGSADLTLSSESLPSWGIMLDGECFQVAHSVQTTYERECFLLPTPTAHNAKEGAYPAEFTRNTPTLAAQIGGKVNPDWNEWRMIFPIKWTALEPLATHSLQSWLQAHSGFCQESTKIEQDEEMQWGK